eukprot:4318279-Prymnesium_polylepis.1
MLVNPLISDDAPRTFSMARSRTASLPTATARFLKKRVLLMMRHGAEAARPQAFQATAPPSACRDALLS